MGYGYAHDAAWGVAADFFCLPPAQGGGRFYEPTERGLESDIKRKLDELRRMRGAPPTDENDPEA